MVEKAPKVWTSSRRARVTTTTILVAASMPRSAISQKRGLTRSRKNAIKFRGILLTELFPRHQQLAQYHLDASRLIIVVGGCRKIGQFRHHEPIPEIAEIDADETERLA